MVVRGWTSLLIAMLQLTLELKKTRSNRLLYVRVDEEVEYLVVNYQDVTPYRYVEPCCTLSGY